MRLDWLRRLTRHPGPFATVVTDASRDHADAERALGARWDAHATGLAELGVPDAVVRALRTVVTSPTHRGGAVGRVAVADAGGVLLDQVLPEPPVAEQAAWGPVPDLTSVVRALSRSTTYLLAEVDAAGAYLQAVSARGDELEGAVVTDGRTALGRAAGGGWSLRRVRVGAAGRQHDADLAQRLVAEVRRHQPEVLLVAGARCAVTSVLALCPRGVTDLVVRLSSGTCVDGAGSADLTREVDRVLVDRCRRRDDAVIDRHARAGGTAQEVVSGRDAVLAALRAGLVDELLLTDASGRPGRTARQPREPGTTLAELVWAAVAAGAGVTMVPPDRAGRLGDGAGAILRATAPAATSPGVAAGIDRTYT